jgi:ribose-phosphate pyrophosphokinase
MQEKGDFLLFSGSSHPQLARELAELLQMSLGSLAITTFPDREIGLKVQEDVRDKDVCVLQSLALDPQRYLVELIMMVETLKRLGARRVNILMPYYGYARQDRSGQAGRLVMARVIADILQNLGVHRILICDVHTEQVEGFFRIPVRHLRAEKIFIQKLSQESAEGRVIVAPDIGSYMRAKRYGDALGAEVGWVEKQRLSASTVQSKRLWGDVTGKDVVLVDDIASTGETLREAAQLCTRKGAKTVKAVVTHWIRQSDERIAGLEEIWVTNSVPNTCVSRVTVLSIAPLLAEELERMRVKTCVA